jgi:non-ribosomal peptide synthetase component F
MYIIPDDVIYDPPALCDYLRRNSITEMLFTPSLLQAVLDTQQRDVVQSAFATMRCALHLINKYKYLIRKIWLCGEVVTVSLLSMAVATLPWVAVLNLYSISETHDVAVADLSKWYSSYEVVYITNINYFNAHFQSNDNKSRRQFAPVGKIFAEVKVAILDEHLQRQPIGMSGEVHMKTIYIYIRPIHPSRSTSADQHSQQDT